MKSSAQREYSRIAGRTVSDSARSTSPETWSTIRLVGDVLVEAARILRGAHQRGADCRRDFKAAVREKQNVAALQNGPVIGCFVCALKLQALSVSR